MSTQEEKDCLAVIVGMVVERADRLMHRESTDFVGRIYDAVSEAEEALDEAGDADPMPVDLAEQYVEALTELAALAVAQIAMVGLKQPDPAK